MMLKLTISGVVLLCRVSFFFVFIPVEKEPAPKTGQAFFFLAPQLTGVWFCLTSPAFLPYTNTHTTTVQGTALSTRHERVSDSG